MDRNIINYLSAELPMTQKPKKKGPNRCFHDYRLTNTKICLVYVWARITKKLYL